MFVPIPAAAPPVIIRTEFFYNKFTRLDGSLQFVVGEGIYQATEELELAHPAPHPSEPPPNPNPLTPQAPVLSSGMHLSVLSLNGRTLAMPRMTRQISYGDSANNNGPASPSLPQMQEEAGEEGHTDLNDSVSGIAVPGAAHGLNTHAEASGLSTTPGSMPLKSPGVSSNSGPIEFAPLSPVTTTMTNGSSIFDGQGRRKKRTGTSANGTTSTFVSRAITDPAMSTRMADRNGDEVFIFTNVTRCLSWMDLGAPDASKHEPMSRLLFAVSNVTCHDVNQVTRTARGFDVVIGTHTGDICWYDPVSSKYLRFNKQRCINPTGVTRIAWMPNSENLFMAAHADGALVIYDKDREDADFVSAMGALSINGATSVAEAAAQEDGLSMVAEKSNPAMHVLKTSNGPVTKNNPVSYLSISRQAITDFALSPDSIHVAVVGDDGCLRIIDYRQEKLLDVYSSYFGGFTCVAWSPDGQYVVTGGKDDLVSIWSMSERRLVARCHGHSSFINCVAFDPWRCEDGGVNYRIGSVSDDCKLLLWDFAHASLHKPSAKARAGLSVPETRPRLQKTSRQSPSGTVYHEPESRLSAAILSPIMVKKVDDQPPTHLTFLKDHILVASIGRKYGRIRKWRRPDGTHLPVSAPIRPAL
ncbi:hypothetical protein PYCC9005_003714 [Savitreella phatthalungensis]